MKKLVLLISLYFIGNWVMDIGQIAHQNHLSLTNGFWTISGVVAWHFGWYITIISCLLICFFYAKEKEKQVKK